MGETGCGKTSLIRKLSEMKNDGQKDKMKLPIILAHHSITALLEIFNTSQNVTYLCFTNKLLTTRTFSSFKN